MSAAVEVFTNNSTKIKDAYPFVKDNQLCVSGLDFGKTYTLKLHKGINFIKKTQGTDKTLTTNTDSDTTFTTIDETSSVKIAKGLILPSNEKQKLVELETVNTDAVTLGVFKISNNSLPQAELFSLYSENPEQGYFEVTWKKPPYGLSENKVTGEYAALMPTPAKSLHSARQTPQPKQCRTASVPHLVQPGHRPVPA